MNSMLLISMVILPLVAAPLMYAADHLSKGFRKLFCGAVLLAEFILSVFLSFWVFSGENLSFDLPGACGMGISLKLDGVRAVHLILTCFLWVISEVYNVEYASKIKDKRQGRYQCFTLLTLSATVGVFLSADLFTTFVFFEVMSFASYLWVLHDGKKESLKAAETYLGVSVTAGMVMLMGIFLLYQAVGTLSLEKLSQAFSEGMNPEPVVYLAGALILVGFGAKAGLYPLHIWLPKAYPAAPAPASALLSGVLSKAGVYGIIVVTSSVFLGNQNWGIAVLVLGVITMFWGGILALFSMDFKKIIACSSMSQIGFITVGIAMQCLLGTESSIAMRGTLLHIVNHSLIKLVLFLLTGVVYVNLGKYHLNDIKGFGRGKPFFAFAFSVAAFGVAGVPLFNGYISKTLLHESIVEYAAISSAAPFFTLIEWIFLISGGLTVAYMLKIFVVLFLEKGKGQKSTGPNLAKKYMSLPSKIAVLVPCLCMLAIGCIPNVTAEFIAQFGLNRLPPDFSGNAVAYFSLQNLKGAGISLLFGILFYVILVRRFLVRKTQNGNIQYLDHFSGRFDLENRVYRPLILKVLPGIVGGICGFLDQKIIPLCFRTFMSVLGALSAFFSAITDTIIRFLVCHVFCERVPKTEEKISKPITYETGKVLDTVTGAWSRVISHKQRKGSYAQLFQHYEEESAVRRKMIAASLSYGLLFCGIGLVVVLLYLLFR